jgi:hypothetical protein
MKKIKKGKNRYFGRLLAFGMPQVRDSPLPAEHGAAFGGEMDGYSSTMNRYPIPGSVVINCG